MVNLSKEGAGRGMRIKGRRADITLKILKVRLVRGLSRNFRAITGKTAMRVPERRNSLPVTPGKIQDKDHPAGFHPEEYQEKHRDSGKGRNSQDTGVTTHPGLPGRIMTRKMLIIQRIKDNRENLPLIIIMILSRMILVKDVLKGFQMKKKKETSIPLKGNHHHFEVKETIQKINPQEGFHRKDLLVNPMNPAKEKGIQRIEVTDPISPINRDLKIKTTSTAMKTGRTGGRARTLLLKDLTGLKNPQTARKKLAAAGTDQ